MFANRAFPARIFESFPRVSSEIHKNPDLRSKLIEKNSESKKILIFRMYFFKQLSMDQSVYVESFASHEHIFCWGNIFLATFAPVEVFPHSSEIPSDVF